MSLRFIRPLYCLLCLALGTGTAARGQAPAHADIRQLFARYQVQALPEKLFLHLDQPLYLSGETAWFRIYAVDGVQHRPLPLSTVAYVEVLDKAQRPVLQTKIALRQATGHGSLVLPATLASGRYTVRAYTSWMQNFSPEYFFREPITIVNPHRASAGKAVRPDSAAFDVQLFPEGGHLVAGVASRLAFKVTGPDGNGLAARGAIVSEAGDTVARFRTARFGLGSTELPPLRAGSSYAAVVKSQAGGVRRVKLPPASAQGYAMRLDDSDPERLTITVTTRNDNSDAENIIVLGHARQQVFVYNNAYAKNNQVIFAVNKRDVGEGISHFTVFNAANKPVCERLYFKPPSRQLAIEAKTDNAQYGPRQKVRLQYAAGAPNEAASLSVAVYRQDALSAGLRPDIHAYLWLNADLRGMVESPDFYFSGTPEAQAAADHLMLTQGWSRFRWDEVLAGKPADFQRQPELNGHLVRGRVLHPGTGQPAENVPVYLASPSLAIRFYSATTDKNGVFQREMKDLIGPKQLVAQPANRADSLFRIEVLSPFSQQYPAYTASPFRLTDYPESSLVQRHVQAQVQNIYSAKFHNRFRPVAVDSVPFYGKADEVYRLDDYTRFKLMEDILREYVPGVQLRKRADGFYFMVADKINKTIFSENPLVLLDGVPVLNINKIMAFDPLKIRRLDVVASHYFHGTATHKGVVSFSTYQGDLAGFELDAHALLQEYEGVQRQREFYAPRYDTPEARQSRLPDLRNLLYWNPAVTGSQGSLEFYTSDEPGRYVVVVQGLSASGEAGSRTVTFEVKAAQ